MTDDARIAQIREQMGTRLPNGTLCIIRTRKNAAEYDLLDAYDACQSALAAMKAERDALERVNKAIASGAHEAGAVWMREMATQLCTLHSHVVGEQLAVAIARLSTVPEKETTT